MTAKRIHDASELPTARPGARMPNLHALSYAAQMVVWAVRKQLHSIAHGDGGSNEVLSVFHLVNWGTIYEPLLGVVEALRTSRAPSGLILHAITCPVLATHELCLLNALAYLQRQQPADAAIDLCESLRPACARSLLAHLQTISDELSAQGFATHFVAYPPADQREATRSRRNQLH